MSPRANRSRATAGTRGSSLVEIARTLHRATSVLRFGDPVAHVYAPLHHARDPAEQYLQRYGDLGARVLLLGMNPGPFGMVQTGVPFGDVAMVRDWLGIEGLVESPARVHPQRPILGFALGRREVSGSRLYGWAKERFLVPECFFQRFFLWNYCPLAFLESSGRNRTPDRLPPHERTALFLPCDTALRRVVATLQPDWVLGVGRFAFQRARIALPDFEGRIGEVPHPSPASPAANRGYTALLERRLRELGIAT